MDTSSVLLDFINLCKKTVNAEAIRRSLFFCIFSIDFYLKTAEAIILLTTLTCLLNNEKTECL